MSCNHTQQAEKKFGEWLELQPEGTEWTAHDIYAMLKGNGYELLSTISASHMMKKFDNVKVVRREYLHSVKKTVNVYQKVS